jgi:hypothetical protein
MENLSIETLNRDRFINGHWFQHNGKPNVYFRHNAEDMMDGFSQLDLTEIGQYYALVTDIFDQYAMCTMNIFGVMVNFRLIYDDCRTIVSRDGQIIDPYRSAVLWPELTETIAKTHDRSFFAGSSAINRSINLNNRTRFTF